MNNTYERMETEYSKLWASNNPELFTKNVLEFIEQHPSGIWEINIAQTKGFLTLSAKLI